MAIALAAEAVFLLRHVQAHADLMRRRALVRARAADEAAYSTASVDAETPEVSSPPADRPSLPRVAKHVRDARLRSSLVAFVGCGLYASAAMWFLVVAVLCLDVLAGGTQLLSTWVMNRSIMYGGLLLVLLPVMLAIKAIVDHVALSIKMVEVPAVGRAVRQMAEMEESRSGR